jgi:hypothetical protein
MAQTVQITNKAGIVSRNDARSFFKKFTKSKYSGEVAIEALTQKIVHSTQYSEEFKKLTPPLVKQAAGKITLSDSTHYYATPLPTLSFDDSNTSWSIGVAKRINPPAKTFGRLFEGVASLTAAVATGIGSVLLFANAPVVAVLLGAAAITTAVFAIANPISKIKSTRNENLQKLANVLETGIINALKSVVPKQEQA